MMPHLIFPLLACLCFFLASCTSPAHGETSPGLYPVVLVPCYTCSNLDARLTDEYQPPPGMPWCGAMKGKGWFRLWKNQTALQDPRLMPCYADQLRLVYDHTADDYRNAPGVETRVVAFGSTRGFGSDDPAMKDGENMFGANYDFRYAAAPPRQPSDVFDSDLSRIRDLVEHASRKNGGKPVIFVSHAFGGYLALEFLSRSPLSWRQRLIKHYLMLSRGDGGDVVILRTIASANAGPSSNVLFYANTSRSFASPLAALASPRVFGHAPLVVTRDKNYSAFELSDLLSDLGFSDVAPRYLRRALPVTLGIRAPLVLTTTVVGVGLPSPVRLTYWDGDFGKVPQVANDDGDGFMNFEVVSASRTVIDNEPDQGYFKLILLPNVTHYGVVSDDFALTRLVEIVAEINQSTS
ncbi:hypothetical protein HU200_033151 [Digitaria exilis]|uniref:Uncharacterized protein n=1 Tax=Digitaria exilis TaxID=1010633 RepID=A0A835BRX4_9POAL|nr:hypothetical protein HU200_033151 [Digitaria exilis]